MSDEQEQRREKADASQALVEQVEGASRVIEEYETANADITTAERELVAALLQIVIANATPANFRALVSNMRNGGFITGVDEAELIAVFTRYERSKSLHERLSRDMLVILAQKMKAS